MAKDRRSRDQKRRDKLAKRKLRSPEPVSLAYMGRKFQTDELVPTFMYTEIGIYETYVITDRKLLDSTVVAALEKLIRQMRAGTLPPLTDTDEINYQVGQEEEFLIENIRRSWEHHFQEEWQPPRDKLIGVLRSTLGSIEKVRVPGPRSQAYLHHIAGFLTKKLGVSVKQVSADMKPLPEPAEDELVQLGHQWVRESNQDARSEFYELASHLIEGGHADRVINGCHLLMGEESDVSSEAVAELSELSRKARQSPIRSRG